VADNSYPKKFRLLSANDFSNLKEDSRSFRKSNLTVYFKKNNLGISRLGLSVSTRVGNSVKRNKIKRSLRECFRNSELKILGIDLLCVVFPDRQNSLDDSASLIKKNFSEFNNFLNKSK
jgi:ribonuclease P protein component